MRTILGRLADLGLPQLFNLLTSSHAQGVLELDTAAGAAVLAVREDQVSGDLPSAVLVACRARAGTFRFKPGEVQSQERWRSVEELIAALDGVADDVTARDASTDPFADLRDSLSEIELPGGPVEVTVVTADPRPYRAMELDWQARGWKSVVLSEPNWPEGPEPRVMVLHLPTSVTLVGQETVWLELARLAGGRRPPVPVIWVGGLTDPWLRHQAVMAGVLFLLPAPVGEVGETARWFRDEITLLVERALTGRQAGPVGDGEAFRDFFFALNMDATPAEARASLLRVAGAYYGSGMLLTRTGDGYESIACYGLPQSGAVKLPPGDELLESLASKCQPVSGAAGQVLARVLGVEAGSMVSGMPVLAGTRCVAAFVGARPLARGEGSSALRDLLARSGSFLGL